MEISNYTSYFLEARQPTQATTIENLKYETSCQNATLLIEETELITKLKTENNPQKLMHNISVIRMTKDCV